MPNTTAIFISCIMLVSDYNEMHFAILLLGQSTERDGTIDGLTINASNGMSVINILLNANVHDTYKLVEYTIP